MKKFLYIRHQNGGCDYTIGCGISINEISAESKEKAIEKIISLSPSWKEELLENIKDDGDIDGWTQDHIAGTGLYDVSTQSHYKIIYSSLYEVSCEIPMLPILTDKLAEIEKFKKELMIKQEEDLEKQTYLNLKKKFEK